jgi:hypothetical protein
MINNYLHDLATALLAASGAVMLVVLRIAARIKKGDGEVELVVNIYQKVTKIALVSVSWIILGGIPRTIFFKRYEWWDAAGKGIIPALLIKHLIMFSLVGAGVILWLKVRKEITRLTANAKRR